MEAFLPNALNMFRKQELNMRPSPSLIAIALIAASIGVASGQRAAVTTAPKLLGGISLAYDPAHSQFSATGFQLKPHAVKPNVTAPTPTTGTVNVALTINLVSKFRRDTFITCSAIVLGGIIDTGNGTIDGGLETVYGYAVPSGEGTASCNLTIPYSWTLASDGSADSGLIIAFAAGAVDRREGSLRSTVQISGVENLPASGTTSNFAFIAAL